MTNRRMKHTSFLKIKRMMVQMIHISDQKLMYALSVRRGRPHLSLLEIMSAAATTKGRYNERELDAVEREEACERHEEAGVEADGLCCRRVGYIFG